MKTLVTVMAHNEERRIAACLDSLPLDDANGAVAVVVNGSSDGTADIVRGYAGRGVRLVEYAEGGKSRSWNRFVLDQAPQADVYVFVDGDAVLASGSIAALELGLADAPSANAVAALPLNGRQMAYYRRTLEEDQGLFGDCYALRGDFVARLRASGVRLPEDLVGDDSLICALANTDIGTDADFRAGAVVASREAGFYCEPNRLTPHGLRQQAQRMRSYSLRHFQNRIISDIMQHEGAGYIPARMSDLYGLYLPQLRPRLNPLWFAFDRRALERMRAAAG